MADKTDEPYYISYPPGNVVDLALVREALQLPTSLAAILGRLAGGVPEILRPGLVRVALPNQCKTISIRLMNIYELEAKAYKNEGMEVPGYVYADMERWEKENRGR